jgi:glutamine phosphoribosylpyrophosphate amidotransferase
MCGIFGAIGKSVDYGAVRTLALANSERGNEAIGFFGSDGKIWKRAQSPIDALTGSKLNKYLGGAESNGLWFIAGHTRHGTRGSNTRENAHPFRYGKFIGAHNGIVDAPNAYDVDSMYLIDSLSKTEGDYQKALGDVSGYWGLVWTDGDALYLQAHNNTLALCEVDGNYYFSSDWKHLRAALGNVNYHAFTEGETVKITLDPAGKVQVEQLTVLTNDAGYMSWDYRTQGYSGYSSGTSGTTRRVYTGGTTSSTCETGDAFEVWDPDSEYAAIMGLKDRDAWNDVPDYDERWKDAYAEFLAEMNA